MAKQAEEQSENQAANVRLEPCWNLEGFDFQNVRIAWVGHLLYNPCFTTRLQNPDEPTDVDKSRMAANNVAAIFRAMNICREYIGELDFWERFRKLEHMPINLVQVHSITNKFIEGRRAYLGHNQDCPTEVARVVDIWIEWIDSHSLKTWSTSPEVTPAVLWDGYSEQWKQLVDDKVLRDFGERFVEQPAAPSNNMEAQQPHGNPTEASSATNGKRLLSQSPEHSPSAATKRLRMFVTGAQGAVDNQTPPGGTADRAGPVSVTQGPAPAELPQPTDLAREVRHLGNLYQLVSNRMNDFYSQLGDHGTRMNDFDNRLGSQEKGLAELTGRLEELENNQKVAQGNGASSQEGDKETKEDRLTSDASTKELARRVDALEANHRSGFEELNANIARLHDAFEQSQRAQAVDNQGVRLNMPENGLQVVAAEEHHRFSGHRYQAFREPLQPPHLRATQDRLRSGASIMRDPYDVEVDHILHDGLDRLPGRNSLQPPVRDTPILPYAEYRPPPQPLIRGTPVFRHSEYGAPPQRHVEYPAINPHHAEYGYPEYPASPRHYAPERGRPMEPRY
ncbi:hypothetical protein VTJ49DRAFT_1549 [Mycothermus thermophilus]|uniref:Uncharacterized protein n=1 Tax=Humicola insolens TaxID=85995 RepID=A0ABR3VPF2_HUMIN